MTGWDDDRLDALAGRGDPPADDAVARHFAAAGDEADGGGGQVAARARALVTELGRLGVADAPGRSAPLEGFLADRPEPPAWARGPESAALVRQGQDVFALYGVQIGTALFCASLPEGYAAPDIARILWATSRLTDDARRRVAETSQFLLDTMEHGGLEPGAAGWRAIRHVRLMHAAVRHLVGEARPGTVAVDQEQLLGTLLTFTWVPFRAIERFGLPISRSDRAAYLHCWNVVGWQLGIADDVLPLELADLPVLDEAFRRRHQRTGAEHGVLLSDALVTMMQGYLPGWAQPLRGVPATLIRYLVGDDVADLTAIPASDWTRLVFAPMRLAASRVRLAPFARAITRRVGTTMGRRLLAEFARRELRGERPGFAVPEQLARTWKLRRVPTRPPVDGAASSHVVAELRPSLGHTAASLAQART